MTEPLTRVYDFYPPPGIMAKRVKGVHASRTVHGLLSPVCGKRAYRMAICASDNGAITVWRNDDGFLRAQRHALMGVRADSGTMTKRGLALWLATELRNL